MASGFGYSGGRSRCHPFWLEFAKCYANAEQPSECVAQKADYLECLHHTKEIRRAQTVKSHYVQAQQKQLAQKKQEAQTKGTSPGGIMDLNLIVLNKEDVEPQPTGVPKKEEKKQDSKNHVA